ncbi:MAG TPA: cytochrome c biogenesis protein CcdA [Thermomicrobiales bacterium]|jgi:cytochrome c-type biogenesis protein|nr:cytochrome c biogenesis protein CcdA [Thermomicrobiales bacterium]
MATMHSPVSVPRRRSVWLATAQALGLVGTALAAILLLAGVGGAALGEPELTGRMLTLAIPALLAGMLSILSPCSLPIVLGYFSVMFQQQPRRIGSITIVFLLGVGTTMSVLGASFTALGSIAIQYQESMTRAGGVLIIAFGLLTLRGRGFGGLHLTGRTGAGLGAAYLFGLMFALGWTACVGPILGSILTLLLADAATTGGAISLISGAALSQVYVLGMGLPILVVVLGLMHGGNGREIGRTLRGRTLTVSLGGRIVSMPPATLLSGAMLIGLGALMLTGTMTRLSQQLGSSALSQWVVKLEAWIPT